MKKLVWVALVLLLALALWFLLGRGSPSADDGSGTRAGASPTGSTREGVGALADGPGATGVPSPVAPPRCAVDGVVQDADGTAVAGASVLAAHVRRSWGVESSTPARTDAEGRFSYEDLPCDTYRFTASFGEQLARSRAVPLDTGERAEVRLVLEATRVFLSGTVRDAGGGTIAGATLTARGETGSFRTETGDDGTYRLGLTAGFYRVEASAPSYGADQRLITLSESASADFTLAPGAVLSGRVVTRDDETPVPGAAVTALSGWRFRRTVHSDSTGAFSFPALQAGEYELEATAGAYRGRLSERVAVNVASFRDDIVLRLDAGVGVRGRVVDDTRAPVAGAEVRIRVGFPPRGEGAATTGADGRFEILGPPAGEGRITASKTGYASAGAPVQVEDSDVENLELVLEPGVVVRGRVLHLDGKPAAGTRVTGRDASRFVGLPGGGASDVADAEGRFELLGLPAGDLSVHAQHVIGGFAAANVKDARPGTTRELDLRLELGATVAGTVRWADGEPVPGAVVRASSPRQGMRGSLEATADVEGAYRLVGLQEGSYILFARRPDADPSPFPAPNDPFERLELKAGAKQESVDFELQPADSFIEGVVQDADGAPVPDAEVGATAGAGGRMRGPFGRPSASSISDGTGRFLLQDLVAGTYDVSAHLPGFPEGRTEGVETGRRDVVVRIPRGASLTGVVVRPDGERVSTYEVHATLAGSDPAPWAGSGRDRLNIEDPSGVFRFTGLPSGTYRVVVKTPSGGVGEADGIVVEEGTERAGVRIEVTEGWKISGRLLTYGSGTPLVGSPLIFRGDFGSSVSLTTEGGSFATGPLPTGTVLFFSPPNEAAGAAGDRWELEITDRDLEVVLEVLPTSLAPAGSAQAKVELTMASGALRVTTGEPPTGRTLLAVDGRPVGHLGMSGARALMGGDAGTTVTLTVQADGAAAPEELRLERAVVPDSPRP